MPASANAGDRVTITVRGDVATENSTVAIGSNRPSDWIDLPTSVTVQQGQSQVQFQATLATTAQDPAHVSATGGGVTKSKTIQVMQFDP